VVDFGIRSFDLTFALVDGYQAVILVDALQRNEAPGTLYLFEPSLENAEQLMPATMEGHGLHPAQVLKVASLYGPLPEKILVVGCEPAVTTFSEDGQIGLSPAVQVNLPEAIRLIEDLIPRLQQELAAIHG
jgi:hydrogenase maturation protease